MLVSSLTTKRVSRCLPGLVSGTHFVSVSQAQSSTVVSSLGESSCYTLFAEPHYVFDVTAPPYLTPVQNFVNSGGNFFAQCAGTYPSPPLASIEVYVVV